MNDFRLPVVNIRTLLSATEDHTAVAAQLGAACREYGFFYITGHGIDAQVQERLEKVSRDFFASDLQTKLTISMSHGGRAWRGYFPVGGELTSGKPDLKEGI